MKIDCTDNKTYKLTDNSQELGYLKYDGWLSSKADLMIGKENYKIIPKGIFNVVIAVTQDEKEVATMQMNWKGSVVISFLNGQDFILKPTGTFHDKFVLEDKDQQKLVLLTPDFNWAKFNNNYSIAFDNKPKDIMLILLSVYAANYYVASVSAVIY